jgi:RimJ/RimL family protein N-acetyltransferase
MQLTVRDLIEDDAANVLSLVSQVISIAKTTVTAPEEFSFTEEQERGYLRKFRNSQDQLALGCFDGGNLAGVLFLEQMSKMRMRHRAVIGFSVLPARWGEGIGTALMRGLLDRLPAVKHIRQIEASVLSNNPASERLLIKAGFHRIGAVPNAILLDENCLDELLFVLDCS